MRQTIQKRQNKLGTLALSAARACYKALQTKLETAHLPSSHHTQDFCVHSGLHSYCINGDFKTTEVSIRGTNLTKWR